jgi:hypothetical protein
MNFENDVCQCLRAKTSKVSMLDKFWFHQSINVKNHTFWKKKNLKIYRLLN